MSQPNMMETPKRRITVTSSLKEISKKSAGKKGGYYSSCPGPAFSADIYCKDDVNGFSHGLIDYINTKAIIL